MKEKLKEIMFNNFILGGAIILLGGLIAECLLFIIEISAIMVSQSTGTLLPFIFSLFALVYNIAIVIVIGFFLSRFKINFEFKSKIHRIVYISIYTLHIISYILLFIIGLSAIVISLAQAMRGRFNDVALVVFDFYKNNIDGFFTLYFITFFAIVLASAIDVKSGKINTFFVIILTYIVPCITLFFFIHENKEIGIFSVVTTFLVSFISPTTILYIFSNLKVSEITIDDNVERLFYTLKMYYVEFIISINFISMVFGYNQAVIIIVFTAILIVHSLIKYIVSRKQSPFKEWYKD